MKKITAILIVLALCAVSLVALVSCGGDSAETTAAATESQTAEQTEGEATTAEEQTEGEVTTDAEATTAEEATEPEATTAEEATEPEATTAEEATEPEATTAEAGAEINYNEEKVPLFKLKDNHDPISADDGRELACKFTLEEGQRLIGLVFESCPTWNEEGSAFAVELYKWDNDYENTLIGDYLYREEFEDWVDNAECRLDFTKAKEDGFPSGTYLWVFKGTVGKIGIWAMNPLDGCEYYESGVVSQHGYRVNAIVLTPAE